MAWIEELARERGTGGWQTLDDMVSFGKAVAAKERARCAKVLQKEAKDYANEFGHDDMGGLSFGTGAHAEYKMDRYNDLLEMADRLLALGDE